MSRACRILAASALVSVATLAIAAAVAVLPEDVPKPRPVPVSGRRKRAGVVHVEAGRWVKGGDA